MSDAAKKRICSEKTRQKLSKAGTGRLHTEETKRKMSKASTGRLHTEEAKKKISETSTGRMHTEESKRKMSEAQARRPMSTHCKRDHRLIGDNLYISPKSKARICLICFYTVANRKLPAKLTPFLNDGLEFPKLSGNPVSVLA